MRGRGIASLSAACRPEIVGVYREPAGVPASLSSGQFFYLVFDRRAHAVSRVGTAGKNHHVEAGRHRPRKHGAAVDPSAFDAEPGGGRSWVGRRAWRAARGACQVFTSRAASSEDITRRAGSAPPHPPSEQYRAERHWGSLPVHGNPPCCEPARKNRFASMTEVRPRPQADAGLVGALFRRAPGARDDADVHLAVETRLPLVDPRGGFLLRLPGGIPDVPGSTTGGTPPLSRRHIEGLSSDRAIAALRTVWPAPAWRRTRQGSAAGGADAAERPPSTQRGQLWVRPGAALLVRLRRRRQQDAVVRSKGQAILSPSSLSFHGVRAPARDAGAATSLHAGAPGHVRPVS